MLWDVIGIFVIVGAILFFNRKLCRWWAAKKRTRVLVFVVVIGIMCSLILLRLKESRDRARIHATGRQLSSFYNYLIRVSIDKRRFPGPALADALLEMRKDPTLVRQLSLSCEMIVQNRDSWGNAFIYVWKDGGYEVAIRSCGPNGKDDAGLGDDLTMRQSVNRFKLNKESKD